MNAEKKTTRYKLPLPLTMRFAVLAVLAIIFLFTVSSAYTAYQNPTTKKVSTPTLHYNHNSRFDYTVYLKNNTVYNNKTTLRPGEGTIFKQLITHVNASFTDTFQIDQDAFITGNYTVDAILKTTLWTKTYPLIPRTPFTAQGRTAQLTASFPLNYTTYEERLAKINEETGVPAQSPQLIIQSTVVVFATAPNGTVSSVFSPSINVSLNQKTLEISKDLTAYLPGVLTTSRSITLEEVPGQRTLWTVLTIIFLASMPLFMVLTTSSTTPENKTMRELKKIKKKYGEWIVETTTHPIAPVSRNISVNTLEDLSKVSEELGKPILLYTSPDQKEHRFYIFDDTLMYEYELNPEKKTKEPPVSCPQCGAPTIPQEPLGKKIRNNICPSCGYVATASAPHPKPRHHHILFSAPEEKH
jgi:hypothetical protein